MTLSNAQVSGFYIFMYSGGVLDTSGETSIFRTSANPELRTREVQLLLVRGVHRLLLHGGLRPGLQHGVLPPRGAHHGPTAHCDEVRGPSLTVSKLIKIDQN